MVTLSVKSAIIELGQNTDTDAEIATAIGTGATYTHVYGVSIMPISNTQAKIIIVYD